MESEEENKKLRIIIEEQKKTLQSQHIWQQKINVEVSQMKKQLQSLKEKVYK
jgi:hypothetical protein